MDNTQDLKRLGLWTLVGVILIGSFLAVMFMSSTPVTTPGELNTPVSADEWIKGAKDAKVTLVEYSDFQCPACKSREPEVQSMINEFGNHIRVVYRNFPLPPQVHKNAKIASEAAEAAGLQGKFWEMHDALFAGQDEWKNLSTDDAKRKYTEYAVKLGLNVDQFAQDIDSSKVKDLVEEDMASGTAAGVDSTPTFFLNNKEIQPNSSNEFRQLIRDAVEASA